nr:NADH dehydrogenase subunit 4 [Chloeia pocicola]
MLTTLFMTLSLLLLSPLSMPTLIMMLMITSLVSILNIYSPFTTSMIFQWMMVDPLSASLISLTLWISALMMLASKNNFSLQNKPRMFSFMIMVLSLLLMMAFSASNLLLFYILFEGSLIPTLLLIIGWGYQPERLQAGMYLMLYTITASLPLLLSLLMIYNIHGHLSLYLHMEIPNFSPTTMNIWWTATILAFLVKMPMFLTHLWLPKAHVEAPVAGSMILAGILLKLGGYGILRLAFLFPSTNMKFLPLVAAISLWGGVITSLICLRQPDLKSLIAYSSVGHMGLMTAGLMTGSAWGMQGALAMMIAHGLCSSGLFAIANSTYEFTATRSLFLTKGLLSVFPLMALWWFILSATNMAAPPSINLMSEIMLMTSIVSSSTSTIFALAPISFLAAAYSLHLYTVIHHGSPSIIMNPMTSSPQSLTVSLFHFLPLLIIIMKPEIITTWF